MEGYIAPKKPYGFDAMLDDLLEFAARTLVQDGRLSFWMPTMNDELELGIPTHPSLEIVSVCIQPFNKCTFIPCLSHFTAVLTFLFLGSRRLITYRRLPDGEVSAPGTRRAREDPTGKNADDLNAFRKRVCVNLDPIYKLIQRLN